MRPAWVGHSMDRKLFGRKVNFVKAIKYTAGLLALLFSANTYSWAVLVCNFSTQERAYTWAYTGTGQRDKQFTVPPATASGPGRYQLPVGILTTGSVIERYPTSRWMAYDMPNTALNTIIAVGSDGRAMCRNTISPGPSVYWCKEEADAGRGGQMTQFQWYNACGGTPRPNGGPTVPSVPVAPPKLRKDPPPPPPKPLSGGPGGGPAFGIGPLLFGTMELGSSWSVTESCDNGRKQWQGTWKLRPGTKTFDATFWEVSNGTQGSPFTDVIDFVFVSNQQALLVRKGTGDMYSGLLSADGLSISNGSIANRHGCSWTAVIHP